MITINMCMTVASIDKGARCWWCLFSICSPSSIDQLRLSEVCVESKERIDQNYISKSLFCFFKSALKDDTIWSWTNSLNSNNIFASQVAYWTVNNDWRTEEEVLVQICVYPPAKSEPAKYWLLYFIVETPIDKRWFRLSDTASNVDQELLKLQAVFQD